MMNGPMFEAGSGWGGRLSAWFTANRLWAIPGAVVVLVLIIIAIAQAGNDGPEIIKLGGTASPTATPAPSDRVATTIIARDNYTLVARRLITQLADTETPGQRLYAETILQSQLHSQPLAAGATISIESSKIQSTLDAYAALTAYQKSRWEAMARKVRF